MLGVQNWTITKRHQPVEIWLAKSIDKQKMKTKVRNMINKNTPQAVPESLDEQKMPFVILNSLCKAVNPSQTNPAYMFNTT